MLKETNTFLKTFEKGWKRAQKYSNLSTCNKKLSKN